LNGLKRYIGRDISLRVKLDLNRDIFEKINSLHFKWFQDKSAGEHVYKISYDADRIEKLITTVPPEAVSLFPKLVFVIFIIFHLNWKMALFSLCLVPLLYLPPYYFNKKRLELWKIFIKNSQGIFKLLHEMFSRVYFIKAFGKEESFLAKYLNRLKENFKVELDNTKIDAFSSSLASIADKMVMGFIAFFGGYLVIKGKMTLGSLAAIMVYLGQLVSVQGNFIEFFKSVTLGLVSCDRISEVLDKKSEISEKKDAKEFVFNKGSVVFDRVSFGYSEAKYILKDMSFCIEGRHVSIVASSGTGKTTLLNLIARLYDAWDGKISIDGMDTRELKFKSLKGQIGMVLQESCFFLDKSANKKK
jgi:ABC-type bacteriocin/lantibiotic exporter with double-glycine peptidase domain